MGGLAIAVLLAAGPVAAPQAAAAAPAVVPAAAAPPAAAGSWSGDTPGSALAAVGNGSSIDLFYGSPMAPTAWLTRDRQSLDQELSSGSATLQGLYNEWLAIADLRAAVYASEGQLEPDGVYVYPAGPSAVAHALDLALWARENALLYLLGDGPEQPYPSFSNLGYRAGGDYINASPVTMSITTTQVAGILNGLDLPAALFAGDRILLMPYDMPEEYGLTDVVGPGIRIWIGADATIDLPHVLEHELGHAIHFRFGGYDSIYTASGATRPLSSFWQHYLSLRGLTWHDPTRYPWAEQTPECFAEDVASLFDGPKDVLGYQAACTPPTALQSAKLLAWLRGLGFSSYPGSPYQQTGWVQWTYPWPNPLFGDFTSLFFTAASRVDLGLGLSASAVGGPYTVDVAGQTSPLATLQPGSAWSGAVAVPPGGQVTVDADTPSLILSSLQIYGNPAFVPEPRISGVFADTLDSWARADIAAGVRAGIVGGYPNGTFQPNAPVTRAEFARMLAAALPKILYRTGTPSQPLPPDVSPASWEAPFVAAVAGDLPDYVEGQPFLPSQDVTRQEAAAWVVRAFGWKPLTAAGAGSLLATYPDGASTSAIDAPGFATAVNLGLVVGDAGTGLLRPTAPLSRAEAVVLVLRAMQEAPATAGKAGGG